MQPIVLKDAARQPLYEQIYRALKENILSGAFESGEKLPSKRALAKQLSVSLITVENAYAQLAAEGYLYAVQKKGYYVAALETPPPPAAGVAPRYHLPEHERFAIDLRVDRPDAGRFPTATWSRLTRRVLTEQGDGIFRSGEFSGEQALRLQIAAYLRRSRCLDVSPDRILVAAGTESLCDILVKLLGAYRVFALEDPGYRKVSDLYRAAGARCFFLPMDADGIRLDALRASPAEVLHVSPNHQYPTGILTPASRRFELLAWAGERSGRYLIEDDYDSELRFDARPLPPLIAEDRSEKVIYMKCIKIITDKDFNLKSISFNNPRHRYASRGIVLNNDGKVAILNKKNKNEYKLVGGGIEFNESPREAFIREVYEETGCRISIMDELGIIEEEKSLDNFKQTSYIYVARVIDNTGVLHLTQKEIDEGAVLLWLDINYALFLIKDSLNNINASKYENLYHSRFIVKRDYEILKYYINYISFNKNDYNI